MGVCCRNLIEKPRRPHPFFELEGREVSVRLPGRSGEVRIHCKVIGTGPPLLLVHGLMTSSYSFRYIIEPLARYYQVIVPDMPGAGRSEAPEDLSMLPQDVAALLKALIETLGCEPPYVIGNSLGGYETLWLAVLYPDCVRRLIVMHSPIFPSCRLRLLQGALKVPGGKPLFRWLAMRNPERFATRNVHYADASIQSQEESREYGAIFHDRARTDFFIRILQESVSIRAMRELKKRLVEIRDRREPLPPIRLLWAREDVMVPPSFGPRLKELIPDAELVWFDRTSHFLQVDAPERTVEAIRDFDLSH